MASQRTVLRRPGAWAEPPELCALVADARALAGGVSQVADHPQRIAHPRSDDGEHRADAAARDAGGCFEQRDAHHGSADCGGLRPRRPFPQYHPAQHQDLHGVAHAQQDTDPTGVQARQADVVAHRVERIPRQTERDQDPQPHASRTAQVSACAVAAQPQRQQNNGSQPITQAGQRQRTGTVGIQTLGDHEGRRPDETNHQSLDGGNDTRHGGRHRILQLGQGHANVPTYPLWAFFPRVPAVSGFTWRSDQSQHHSAGGTLATLQSDPSNLPSRHARRHLRSARSWSGLCQNGVTRVNCLRRP